MEQKDPSELVREVKEEQRRRGDIASEALAWFLDGRIGSFYPRQDAVEELSESLDISQTAADTAIADTVGDVVDPVQQIVRSGERFVGVIDYRVYESEGAYGYVDFDDRKGKRNRVVCARCVEKYDYDEQIRHATQGEGSLSPGASWQDLLNAITAHYADSHTHPPSDIEPGASLVSGTTIGGNTAFHTGNLADRGAVTITPSTTNQTIPEGFHNGNGFVEGDADLIADNIRQGVDIFGVTGNVSGLSDVLAIGGRGSSGVGVVGTVERFDGSSWTSLPDLPTPRYVLAATNDGQGRPLAIGGRDSNFDPVGTVERYDGAAWQSLPDLPTPRNRLAATTDGQGRPLAIGGFDSNFDPVGTVERFDGSSWQSLSGLSAGRYGLAATTDDQGRPLAIGGNDGNGNVVGTVERYDGSGWQSLPNISTRRELAATTDGAGRPLAIGGYRDFDVFSTVERFDGSSWQSLSGLPAPRYALAATTDARGRPLAIGGEDSNNDAVATVYRYDGSAWQSLPDLPTPRYSLAAATLPR